MVCGKNRPAKASVYRVISPMKQTWTKLLFIFYLLSHFSTEVWSCRTWRLSILATKTLCETDTSILPNVGNSSTFWTIWGGSRNGEHASFWNWKKYDFLISRIDFFFKLKNLNLKIKNKNFRILKLKYLRRFKKWWAGLILKSKKIWFDNFYIRPQRLLKMLVSP